MKMVIKSMLIGVTMTAGLAFLPGESHAQCRLCAASFEPHSLSKAAAGKPAIPLQIEITADLDFSRLTLLSSSGGIVSIDPMSGDLRIRGSIANLGGMALHGEGRLTGEPGRSVRIFLLKPIQLSGPNGSMAELERLETNLPKLARLD
ncbi:DUF4402 domain-containing protein [Parasphingorhabdus sp.]|uniref:DUF4402 domain-containing protein n=1 Tax=Parasphingorhabdus sp. TaxID=2709688 RepID=UPI0030A75E1B|nr:DUF4402 domain-containing protein [Sphingomonadales bacterium]